LLKRARIQLLKRARIQLLKRARIQLLKRARIQLLKRARIQLLAVNVVSVLKCVVWSVTVTVPWKLPEEAKVCEPLTVNDMRKVVGVLVGTTLPAETVWSPQSMLAVNAASCDPLATVPEATGAENCEPGADVTGEPTSVSSVTQAGASMGEAHT
jgi:hypothetical protein